jgi:hypothetical protein
LPARDNARKQEADMRDCARPLAAAGATLVVAPATLVVAPATLVVACATLSSPARRFAIAAETFC